jgi:hypothetical protein
MRHYNRLGKTIGEFFYFFGWGMFWGGWLGALAGTLILPVLGTIFSVAWGLGLGIAFGIVAAFLAAFLYPMQPNLEGVTFYRRRLTLLVGAVTAIGAPIVLLITSLDVLWKNPIWDVDSSRDFVLMVSLLAACIFGGLAAAATASRYTDNAAGKLDVLDGFGNVVDIERYFMKHAMRWWVFLTSATCVALFAVTDYSERSSFYYAAKNPLSIAIEYFIVGLIGTGIVIVLLSLGIGALLGFLNRVYFAEYASHWTMERYRVAVMVIVGAGTLGMAAVWLHLSLMSRDWLPFIGIVVVALYAAYLARGYAEHYYEGLEKPKRKGKPKNDDEIELAQDMA